MEYVSSEDFRNGMRIASSLPRMVPKSFKITPFGDLYALKVNNTYIGRYRSIDTCQGIVIGLVVKNGGRVYTTVSYSWITDLSDPSIYGEFNWDLVNEGGPADAFTEIIDEGGPEDSWDLTIDEGGPEGFSEPSSEEEDLEYAVFDGGDAEDEFEDTNDGGDASGDSLDINDGGDSVGPTP